LSVREELGLPAERPVVLTVARLEPSKGVHVLITAVALAQSRPTLLVVGDSEGWEDGGAYYASLEDAVAIAGCTVRFLGARQDVHRLLWAADVFAFASSWEAFGLVLAEASAAGLPVVSTRAGGCAEVVVDGVTGVLVDPEDAPGFADALDNILNAPAVAADMGRSGRLRAESLYDLRKYDDRIVPIYRDLVE
jgi:glycosyltransferase involved in cell wall biosynthesis